MFESNFQLEGWTFQNINSVFHNPDTLELSYEERLDYVKKQKLITHSNTRLARNPWKQDTQVRLISDCQRSETDRG